MAMVSVFLCCVEPSTLWSKGNFLWNCCHEYCTTRSVI
jgi:hypothetical protein